MLLIPDTICYHSLIIIPHSILGAFERFVHALSINLGENERFVLLHIINLGAFERFVHLYHIV